MSIRSGLSSASRCTSVNSDLSRLGTHARQPRECSTNFVGTTTSGNKVRGPGSHPGSATPCARPLIDARCTPPASTPPSTRTPCTTRNWNATNAMSCPNVTMPLSLHPEVCR